MNSGLQPWGNFGLIRSSDLLPEVGRRSGLVGRKFQTAGIRVKAGVLTILCTDTQHAGGAAGCPAGRHGYPGED